VRCHTDGSRCCGAATSDTSNDGATYFASLFGAQWTDWIFHDCVITNEASQAACEHGNTGGNVIFDGGGDMYDIGNLIMTSLMGTPRGGVIGCDLGAIRYEADFTPIVSTCFGPGGYYEMGELDGLWLFFAQNFSPDPLDFGVIGNLGADGLGQVQEFVFNKRPWRGFVKTVCEATDGGAAVDPSLNHLTIVDSGGSSGYGAPEHRCHVAPCNLGAAEVLGYLSTEHIANPVPGPDGVDSGPCQGSCSRYDDDWVTNISPGSTIRESAALCPSPTPSSDADCCCEQSSSYTAARTRRTPRRRSRSARRRRSTPRSSRRR